MWSIILISRSSSSQSADFLTLIVTSLATFTITTTAEMRPLSKIGRQPHYSNQRTLQRKFIVSTPTHGRPHHSPFFQGLRLSTKEANPKLKIPSTKRAQQGSPSQYYPKSRRYSEKPRLSLGSRRCSTQSDEIRAETQVKSTADKLLSDEQLKKYGGRCLRGYRRTSMLGKGGFAVVWLGKNLKSGEEVALKQILNLGNYRSGQKEVQLISSFFERGGGLKQSYSKHPGVNHLLKVLDFEFHQAQTWIVYELCGQSLGACLYDLRQERGSEDKLYRLVAREFSRQLRSSYRQLCAIVGGVASAIELCSEAGFVHCDVKTENILVRLQQEQEGTRVKEVKLIDYGSSFKLQRLKDFSMATPEYMSPELLNYIMAENKMEHDTERLKLVHSIRYPWVIDVWSLGCVLLELLCGLPLWMSIRTIVRNYGAGGAEELRVGLFAVPGRSFGKIIAKQVKVVQNLDFFLARHNYSGIAAPAGLVSLLKDMLSLDPTKRPSPKEIKERLTCQ